MSTNQKKGKKCLEMFDLFGQKGFVYVKSSEMLTTSTGGILSILLCITLVVAFGFYLAQLFDRGIVAVSTSTIVDPDVSLLLNGSTFMFAVGFNRSASAMLNGSLDFQLEISDTHRSDNGTRTSQTDTTQMIPCPIDYFTNVNNINYTPQYNYYDMGSLYCPNISDPRASNLSLAGNFLAKEFRYMKISVFPCNNATHAQFGLPPCQNQETIDNILETIGRMRFQVYFPTYIVNLYDFNTPIMGNISNQEWLLSPSGLQIFSNMFLTKEVILTDANYLYSRSNDTRTVWTVPMSNFRDEMYNYDNSNELINVTIRMDINGITYYRNYMKIPDLLSKVGGLVPLLFAAFGFMAIRYNQYKIKNFVANEIYTVEKEKDPRSKDSGNSSFMSDAQVHDLEGGDEMHSAAEDKKVKTFNRTLSRYLDKEKMKSSCWRFVQSTACFWLPSTKKKLYQYFTAEKKLREDLDIISIVKRINQLEKFKDLMFTKDQIELFNYTPEPKLCLTEEESARENELNRTSAHFLKKRERYNSIPSLMKIYLSYKKLQNEPDPEQRRSNQKIIKMLGVDMLATLEKLDYEMERDPQLLPYLVKIFPEINEDEVEDARKKTVEDLASHANAHTFEGISLGAPLIQKEKRN